MNLVSDTSPHIRENTSPGQIMRDVGIALIPALWVGIWRLGIRALAVTAVSLGAGLASEWVFCLAARRDTWKDGSAAVTGLLLAMTLPASCPLWIGAVGSMFAVVVMKLLCGGLGQNIFNPALAARALLVLLFPAALTRYAGVDGVSTPTPLHHMAMGELPEESVLDVILGNCAGSIGEISGLALLLGGVYLVWRGVISVRIPVGYMGTVAVLTLIFHRTGQGFAWMLYSLFSGGLMLGAVFMATDYATSPVTNVGQVLYGVGCGVLTVIFRYGGLFPEGVTYAILIMNMLVWALDRWTQPRRFGLRKGKTV